MTFTVPAQHYDDFMGRFSRPLAPLFADAAGITEGQRVLDVGAGPGALTEVLVERVGAGSVVAVEPSPTFVDALADRLPGVTVHRASAEALPLPDDSVDAALASLVVHFMTDPVAGLREMARVTRPGGAVAATVWDHPGGRGPLTRFLQVLSEAVPAKAGKHGGAGSSEGELAALAARAGLVDVRTSALEVHAHYTSFDDWWTPYTRQVGPTGDLLASLDEDERNGLRALALLRMPVAPFAVHATAWCMVGRVPD